MPNSSFKVSSIYRNSSLLNILTADSNTSSSNEYLKKKGKYISYIGIAADEPKRLKRLKENECSMLEKWNMTEQDCLEFLERRNLENPLYENHKRLGCWFCPKQRIETLKILKNEYWQKIARYVDALDRILAEQRQLNYNQKLKKQADVTFNNISKFSQKIEADLLHTLQLEEKHKPVPSNNAVCSSLRGLQVSDTLRSENIQVAILQKIDAGFNKFGKAGFHPLPIFKECMLPGSKLMFDVKLDKAMMATVGINSIDDLLSITQQYVDEIIRILKDAFKKEHPDPFCGIDAANIFVGGNVGFHSKTLLALLAPDDNTAKNTIKVLLNKEFPKHEHIIYDKFASPRLLKCTIYNGELLMMGLAEVRRV